MKILHIVQTYTPAYRYGGSITSVHEMNKWLVKRGEEVTVYTTDIDGPNDLSVPVNKPVQLDGVTVYYFKGSHNFFLRKWFYSPTLHAALRAHGGEFDVFHATGMFLMAATLSTWYAKKFKKPLVISPRGSLMRAPLYKKNNLLKRLYLLLIDRRNLASASAIHFTGEAERDEYLTHGLPLRRAAIIPNGFDPDAFRMVVPRGAFRNAFQISQEKKIILFFSRISWKKGLDILISAFKKVYDKNPRAFLVIAGGDDEGYGKTLLRFIRDLHLEKAVLLPGLLTGDDRISAYQDADIFTLPSYSENFGNVVLEAMYFRLPLVITHSVGVSSVIECTHSGLVIEPDQEALAAALLQLLENPSLARELGERGKQILNEEFSWDNVARAFQKTYKEISI